MARLRIAHFSDIHFTLSPFAHARESLHGKRLAGCLSYLVGGRRARFHKSPDRIATLLADIDANAVDHAVCTGDLTAASLASEFTGLAALFGERLSRPERYTVLPGNHDRYVASALRERVFERHFAELCPGAQGGFPFAKSPLPGLRIVAIDAARPTGFSDASGLCGAAQRERLAQLLAADTDSATIVAMHYGLLRSGGGPDKPRHRLCDYREVLDVLDASPARIAAVLHGHMHGAFTVPAGRHTVICAGSAIDLLVDCGYFIYELDLATLHVGVERRHWNRLRQRFESVDCVSFERAVHERRGHKLAHQQLLT